MIRTSTVVYIILLLALVGAYFYLRQRPEPAEIELTAEPTEVVSYLFSEDNTPTSIRITSSAGDIVEVARDAENAWILTQPVETRADQAAAEAAASQVTTMRILDTVLDVDPELVGLTDPHYSLLVEFAEGGERSAEIGVITPTESGYYVRTSAGEIIIVSRSSIDALLGLLENPPYLETPMPNAETPIVETPVAATPTP
jgi:hypothetical protein